MSHSQLTRNKRYGDASGHSLMIEDLTLVGCCGIIHKPKG